MLNPGALATSRWHPTPAYVRFFRAKPPYRRLAFRLIALRFRFIWEYSDLPHAD